MHLRSVQLNRYKRVDGCWDIEARITDTKDHDYPISSKTIARGEPVTDMWVRITIDQQMNVLDAVASSDAALQTASAATSPGPTANTSSDSASSTASARP